jgi:flagellar basal-body rod protein FlgB
MDLNGIPLFSMITNRMNWLSSRQSLLSENVANASTPNYVARDMKPVDFGAMLAQEAQGTRLNTTNTRHIALRGNTGNFQPEEASGEAGTPGGNVVSLEQEMIKLSDTQLQYQAATNIYQKAVGMFRIALGGSGQQ